MSPLALAAGGLTLAEPAWLASALAVPLALAASARRRAARLTFAPAALAGGLPGTMPLPRTWRTRLVGLPALLMAAGVLALIVALARPQARSTEPVVSAGRDVLLAFDVSSSMAAEDLARGRSRLALAREAARAFVDARPEDRLGLVAFARWPELVCPLTRDHAALLDLLERVTTVTSDGPEDATGIGAAVAKAAETLGRAPGRSRVVVLLTDGEENVAVKGAAGEIAPAHAAQLAAGLGVRVHAVVVGGARDPGRAPADLGPVAALAAATGGRVHPAGSAADLRAVYAAIDELEATPLEAPRAVHEDRFLPFLAVGLLLLLLARLLLAPALEPRP